MRYLQINPAILRSHSKTFLHLTKYRHQMSSYPNRHAGYPMPGMTSSWIVINETGVQSKFINRTKVGQRQLPSQPTITLMYQQWKKEYYTKSNKQKFMNRLIEIQKHDTETKMQQFIREKKWKFGDTDQQNKELKQEYINCCKKMIKLNDDEIVINHNYHHILILENIHFVFYVI